MDYTIVTRTQQIQVSKHSDKDLWNKLDLVTYKSKDLYNLALYNERQTYLGKIPNIPKHSIINYNSLLALLKDTNAYQTLNKFGSSIPQQLLRQVAKDFQTKKKTISDFYRNPLKYNNKQPKLSKYLHKTKGRHLCTLTTTNFTISNNQIHLNTLEIHLRIPNNLQGLEKQKSTIDITKKEPNFKLIQIRLVPNSNKTFTIELVYDKKIKKPQFKPIKRAASIDLGVNNLATIVTTIPNEPPIIINGRELKSYNKHFNKKLAAFKSELPKTTIHPETKLSKTPEYNYTSNKINNLINHRNNYFQTRMHQISSYIVKYLQSKDIQSLTIGYNTQWKSNSKLSKVTNQTFIQIPYTKLINYLQYKCYEAGIQFQTIQEQYTSGTSFLDNEPPEEQYYNKFRRIHRGLFVSNTGVKINSDVNGAYQILFKQFPQFQYRNTKNLKFQNPTKLTIGITPSNLQCTKYQKVEAKTKLAS